MPEMRSKGDWSWQRFGTGNRIRRRNCDACAAHARNMPPRQSERTLACFVEIGKLKPKWYPKNRLAYNGELFMKREGKEAIADLFTRRNLYALSRLFDEIEKIENKKLRGVFEFAFTSMVHLASKMCPVAKEGGKGHWSALSTTSFWAVQSYWTPPMYMESNVWMLFESAVFGKQGVLKGKADAAEQVKSYKRAKTSGGTQRRREHPVRDGQRPGTDQDRPSELRRLHLHGPALRRSGSVFRVEHALGVLAQPGFGLRGGDHHQRPAEEGFRLLPQDAQVGLPGNVSGAEAEPISDRDVPQHRNRGLEFDHQGGGSRRL